MIALCLRAGAMLLTLGLGLYPLAHAAPARPMTAMAACSAVLMLVALVTASWVPATTSIGLLVVEYGVAVAVAGHLDPLAPLVAVAVFSLAELVDLSFSTPRGTVREPGARGMRLSWWLQASLIGGFAAVAAVSASRAIGTPQPVALLAASAAGLAGLTLIVLLARTRIEG